ncbi:MAG: hypothetical protein KDC97_11155 [Confluentibacter sp.]|nr:hypothetical protein [Confluentibacter sp.]
MIGLGSLSELKTHYLISQQLKLSANNENTEQNLKEIKRLGFRNYLIKASEKVRSLPFTNNHSLYTIHHSLKNE